MDDLYLSVVGSVKGHVGEPIPFDPQMIHSVATASDLEFEYFLHSVLRRKGRTKCGIRAARIREKFPNFLVLPVGRPDLDPGTLGLKGTFHRLF
jgi:hypothetical protein